MLIEEEESKLSGEINPDALEGVFEDVVEVDEVDIVVYGGNGEDEDGVDEIDIAFQANDEGYW